MRHTRYANYEDDELLRLVDDKRIASPLIDELCSRLEEKEIIGEANHRVECPICEAQLEADYDEGNTMFTIKLEK